MGFIFDRPDVHLVFVLKLGAATKQKIEDVIAYHIQRIVTSARSRNVRPIKDEVELLYGNTDVFADTPEPYLPH